MAFLPQAVLDNLSAMMGGSKPESSKSLQEQWGTDRDARKVYERQWQINVSYYLGNQWIEWIPTAESLETLKAPPWKRMAVDNKLAVKIRSSITRMIARPGAQVIPESTSDEDQRIAAFKERVLEHVHREADLSQVFYSAAVWGKVAGDAYLEVYWDPEAGDRTNLGDGQIVRLGDVRVKTRSPYEVWPGATCTERNWGGRVWIGELLPTEMLRQKYPSFSKLKADAASYVDVKLRYRLGTFFGEGVVSNNAWRGTEELTFVRTRYLLPTPTMPQGSVQTIISDEIVEEKPIDWFGLVHYQNMPNFGNFYGDTELRQALGRQKTYNRILSSIEEYLRVMKGKWIIHRSNEITDYQPDSEHGEKLEWSGGGPPPTMVSPPGLPADIWQLLQNCQASIDDLFSDHLASQGKTPGGNISGAAINYLIEEDDRQHTPTIMKWEKAIEECYTRILDLAALRYTPQHRVTIVGEDRRADVEEVDPALLSGSNKVYIALGSSLPKNKTLRSEVIRRNFAEGIYGDKNDPDVQRKTLKQLDAGIVNDVFDDAALDEIRAEKENKFMAQGFQITPQKGEDDKVHNRKHYHYMKTDQYNKLPPNIKSIFEAHTAIHDMKFMMEVMSGGMETSGNMTLPPSMGIPPTAASSPSVGGPKNLTKEVTQSAEAPPLPGPGVPMKGSE